MGSTVMFLLLYLATAVLLHAPHLDLRHKSIPWRSTCFQRSYQTRREASSYSTSSLPPSLSSYNILSLFHPFFNESEQTPHDLPTFNLSKIALLQDQFSFPKQNTMWTCSTLHGASVLLETFTSLPPGPVDALQPFLQSVLRPSGLVECVSEDLCLLLKRQFV